jgi:hypothetical protein
MRFVIPVLLLALAVHSLIAQTDRPAFAEDFESGAIDHTVWSEQVTGSNIVKVQQDRVAHGKYALLVRCPAPAQRTSALLVANKIPEALREHHFGRVYVYITPELPVRHTIFLNAGSPGFPKYKYEEVATVRGKFQLTYVDQVNGGEDYHSGGPDIPLDRWFLLEWEFGDNPNRAAVWVDGEKAYETPFTFGTAGGDKLVGGFSEFVIGFRLWGAAPNAFDIYYDDIALDPKRIGPVK